MRCFSAQTSLRYVGTISGVLLVVIGLALDAGHASGQAEPPQPVFDDTACNLPGLSPEISPRLRCGTVSVPRSYDNPGAGRFKLAVVVVRSAQQPAFPDPVVYINGGPGSPLTIYADQQARTRYTAGRDLILVDQRGTGRSEPKLCPDLDGALFDAGLAVAADPGDDALAKRRTIYAACRSEATAHGFDLTDFGTSVTVADFEWVRRALGIERWNVYGESYGTTVAMTLVTLHPETVRAAVLDSIYPPDPTPMQSTNVADALAAFFRYCSGDRACADAYPDLAGTYRETVSGLARAPLTVPVPPKMHRPNDRVSLTSTLFEALVGSLIYYPSAYPSLPRLIATVHDRDSQGLGKVLASTYAARAAEVNQATNIAVECRDRPHYRDPLPAGASVLDRLQLYGRCDDWSEIGPRAARADWHRRADAGADGRIRPRHAAIPEPACGGTDRSQCALGRVSPYRSQRQGVQSVRGQNRRRLHRQSREVIRHIVHRSRRAYPFSSEIADTCRSIRGLSSAMRRAISRWA